MKGIQVTGDNYRKLAGQYDLPESELKGAIGWWMVVPFGREARPEGFLTKTQLLAKFDLGGKIKNGWYDLQTKPPVLQDFYLLDPNGDPQKVTEEQYYNPPAGWTSYMNPIVVDYQSGTDKHVFWSVTFNGVVTSTNPTCLHFITKVDEVTIIDFFCNTSEELLVKLEEWEAYLIANNLGEAT